MPLDWLDWIYVFLKGFQHAALRPTVGDYTPPPPSSLDTPPADRLAGRSLQFVDSRLFIPHR